MTAGPAPEAGGGVGGEHTTGEMLLARAATPGKSTQQRSPPRSPVDEGHCKTLILGEKWMPAEVLPARGARLCLPKPPDHSSPGNPPGEGGGQDTQV